MDNTENIKHLYTCGYSANLGCMIWTIPFNILIIWATVSRKIGLLIIGIIVTYIISKSTYQTYKESKIYNKWLDDNNNSIIFFYPLKKTSQTIIQELIGRKINSEIKQVYYDGPTLVGTVTNKTFIKLCLAYFHKSQPNHPRLIQIKGSSIYETLDLKHLINIKTMKEDQIQKVINQINDNS